VGVLFPNTNRDFEKELLRRDKTITSLSSHSSTGPIFPATVPPSAFLPKNSKKPFIFFESKESFYFLSFCLVYLTTDIFFQTKNLEPYIP